MRRTHSIEWLGDILETNNTEQSNIVQFDQARGSGEKVFHRSHGGYGGFLFDKKFISPEKTFKVESDVSEEFFKWAEQYPIEKYWNAGCFIDQHSGQTPMPYQFWKGIARQMIVSLLQKYMVDASVESSPPDVDG
jgi:hypothetical protein